MIFYSIISSFIIFYLNLIYLQNLNKNKKNYFKKCSRKEKEEVHLQLY
jgi:hypothetical protein